MKRPLGVTLIGCWCLLAGVYLCSIALVQILTPQAIPSLRHLPVVYALKLVSPYYALAIGGIWAGLAWGLFKLHDWARWAAQIVLAIGIAFALPMMYFNHIHFGWRTLAEIADMILRVLAVGYLFAPKVMDAFLDKRNTQGSVPASLRGR
jgi:hypothetical protein